MEQQSHPDRPTTRLLDFIGRHPDTTKVFTNGRRIHLVLSHYPAPPHGPDPDYTIGVEESDEQVIVAVENKTPSPSTRGRGPRVAKRRPFGELGATPPGHAE